MTLGQREQFDVIVVGAGLTGAATAWSLSRRARSVLLIEQSTPANTSGSSHGSARIVRRAYGDPLYTELTGLAFELWRELEDQSGAQLLRLVGGLDFGAGQEVDAVIRNLVTRHVAHEVLSVGEAEERWPGMTFAGNVVFHPQAGTVDAATAVGAFIAEARRHGTELLTGARVLRISPGESRAEVELADGERLVAGAVVAAVGAWTQPLLGQLVALPRLTVTQQQIFHFPRLHAASRSWPSVIDQSRLVYHLAGGRDGGPEEDRKVAEHRHGTVTSATGRSGVVDPASRTRVVGYVKRWLPGLDPTPGREATCLYTSTASEDFIIDRVDSLVICSPCSGHGAKFAPLVGELAADLVTAPGRAAIPARFRLGTHRGRGD